MQLRQEAARGDMLPLTRLLLRGLTPRVRFLSRGFLNHFCEDPRGKQVCPQIPTF